jgi:hypothetical protein
MISPINQELKATNATYLLSVDSDGNFLNTIIMDTTTVKMENN